MLFAEGRNSGGPSNQQDPHRSPPDIDDGSSEDPGDPHGRGRTHIDHVTQLQSTSAEHPHSVTPNRSSSVTDKDISSLTRRGQKRRLRDDSSGTSDEEDADDIEKINQIAQPAHRNAVLSPSSSSCHSTTAARVTVPAVVGSSAATDTISVSPKTLPVSREETDTSTSTSVKDLEHAMSKHLPTNMLTKSASPPLSHHPTDFSTDALLKQQQQRSTIQWIGAHHHLNHLNHQQLQHGQGAGTSPLPASALLRQLYANRESVIRANVHGITTATSSGRAGAGGAAASSYYSSDVNQVGPLPTPPGSEGSSTYSEHQFMLQHQKPSNGDTFGSLVSAAAYSTTGGYAMDYHNAMTPPSSVSPRDKQQIHGGVSFDNAVPMYSDVLRHQYLGGAGPGVGSSGAVAVTDSPAQPLPLKPQVYSAMHPSALDAYVSSSPLDQSQFYHHGATGAGFHLYHPANKTAPSTAYPDALKNSTNWYSTS